MSCLGELHVGVLWVQWHVEVCHGCLEGPGVCGACGEGCGEHAVEGCTRDAAGRGVHGDVGHVVCKCSICSMSVQVVFAMLRGARVRSCVRRWVSAMRRARWCAVRRVVVVVARGLGAACGRCAEGAYTSILIFTVFCEYLLMYTHSGAFIRTRLYYAARC